NALDQYITKTITEYTSSVVGVDGGKVVKVPIAPKIDLSSLFASPNELDTGAAARKARQAQRRMPLSFQPAGEEDPHNYRRWTEAKQKERAKMKSTARSTKAKRALLRRMEDAAGRADELGKKFSHEFKKSQVFSAVVIIVDPHDSSRPLLILHPPSAIPSFVQSTYESAISILYLPPLSHNLGVACPDTSCAPCAAAVAASSANSSSSRPFLWPRILSSGMKPADSLQGLNLAEEVKEDEVEEVKLRRQGRAEGMSLYRREGETRSVSVLAWDLAIWPGEKSGTRSVVRDEALGMDVLDGPGNGLGSPWPQG
ncbi:hypothetical protein JCM8097_003735, partial [Rhodosporidiobolus ruineniae]